MLATRMGKCRVSYSLDTHIMKSNVHTRTCPRTCKLTCVCSYLCRVVCFHHCVTHVKVARVVFSSLTPVGATTLDTNSDDCTMRLQSSTPFEIDLILETAFGAAVTKTTSADRYGAMTMAKTRNDSKQMIPTRQPRQSEHGN